MCCFSITCNKAYVRMHHMKPVLTQWINKNYLQCQYDFTYQYFCTDSFHNDCESVPVLTVKVLNRLSFVWLIFFIILCFAPSMAYYSSSVIDTWNTALATKRKESGLYQILYHKSGHAEIPSHNLAVPTAIFSLISPRQSICIFTVLGLLSSGYLTWCIEG